MALSRSQSGRSKLVTSKVEVILSERSAIDCIADSPWVWYDIEMHLDAG